MERNDRFVSAALVVVPAKVEIFCGIRVGHGGWTPAYAGVTPQGLRRGDPLTAFAGMTP